MVLAGSTVVCGIFSLAAADFLLLVGMQCALRERYICTHVFT